MQHHTLDVEIGRLLSGPLLACGPDVPIREAARRMAEHRCSAIVVMDHGEPVGIWTEHDALASAAHRTHSADARLVNALIDEPLPEPPDDPADEPANRPIRTVMSQPVRALPASTPAREAAACFVREGIRHGLVIDDNGHALGLVTQTDLVMSQGPECFLQLRTLGCAKPSKPHCIDAAAPFAQALARMREER
ncbi:MAG: CBS domain-containing protein, partial [Paraburkholderia tropica]